MNIEDKTETTAQGSDAYATYDSQGNLIVGKDNQVSPIQQDPKTGNARVDSKPENVVLGTRNGVGKFTHSTETKKPISGDASYAYEKLDTEWITVKVYNPNTHSYDDKQVEVYKLTPGQYMDDEYNVRAKYPERSYYSTDEDYRKAVEVYNNVATYYGQDRNRRSYYVSGATAVGVDNVAEGDHSTAIGNKAKVLNSVSSYYVDASGKLTSNQADAHFWLDEQGNITNSRQGYYASDGTFVDRYYMVPRLIDSSDAVAIGSDVTAEGRSAVAIGHQSYAKEYSVSIGENSVTDYMGVAIGKDNKAKYVSTAIGHTNDANGYYTAALGVNNTAHGDESTAIGYGNSVDGQQQNGGTTPKAYFTHVLGSNNTVKGSYNAVFGDTNTVTGAYALALGGHNKISGENTNDADGDYGIAIGYGNNVEKNALALGLNSNSIHDGSIAIGNQVNRTGDNNNGATDTIAIGTKASVHMKNGIVLGNEAYAGNNGNNSEGAIAIGHQARSAAGESIAIGTQATTGNNVGSTGMTNIGAIALGHNATIEQGGQASAAIGDSARVKENLHDAVALGSQSYADRAANNQGGYDPVSNSKNHNAGSDPVWNSTLAAVSVGSSDHYVWDGTKNIHYAQQTRQITNVAAGKEDTDAVNVAQLKQVVNLVHNGSGVHDYSVKSVNSGTDTNYNNGGASGDNALAAGVSASATGAHSVAVGNGATANGQDSIALGRGVVAESAENAVAIGNGAQANLADSVALGSGSVASRARYRDLTVEAEKAAYAKGNSHGAAWEATANAIAIGNDNTVTRQLTGVAAGSLDTDAVNVAQLKKMAAEGLKFHGDSGDVVTRKLNTQLDVLGGQTDTTKLTATTDGNIGVVSTKAADETSNGKLEIRLAKELKGLTSVQTGDTTVNDDGLTINKAGNGGKDSITINKTAVSIAGNQITNMGSGIDGTKYTDAGDNNGANIGDVKKMADSRKTTVKSTDGSVKVTNTSTDSTHFDYDLSVDTTKVAGSVDLKYKGDNNTQGSNKLSEAVTFSGTANQIVTKAENGKVTFKLADDLTTQTITVAGKDGKDGQPGTPGHIGIDGKDGQSGIGIDGKDGISIKGQNGKDGVTIKGIDGKDGVDGAEGHIGLNGKDGMVDIWTKPGKPGVDGKDGETMTRIVYQGKDGKEHQGATLDDGLKFHGDSGDIVTRKLNTQLDVLGGQTDTNKLTATTDGNIGVVSTKAADETSNGKLEIRLAKELKGLTSVQTGDTTVNDDGLTINKAGNGGKDSITINKTAVSIAGNQITNMGSGIDGTKYTDAGDNNGANIGDVKKMADSRKTTVKSTDGSVKVTNTSTDSTHFDYDLSVDTTKVAGSVDLKYKGDNNTQGSNKLSEAVTFSGTANQIVTKAENGKVTFKLADDLTTQTITVAGKDGKDGQPGTPGHIGIDGKDGQSGIGIDGKDGISIKGQNGKDGVTIKGIDGKDGVDGAEGHIGLNGKDGMVDIWTKPGKLGVDGKDGETMTRIVYQGKDGKEHQGATLDDGLKFVGNDGNVVARRLNDTLSIKGGIDDKERLADAQRVSSRNLGVRQNTAKDGLEIVMTNRPDFEAITVGPDSGDPAHKIIIGQQDNQADNPNPAKGNYIKGLDNTQWDAGHVVANRAATEGQLSQAITDISGKDKGGFGLADEAGGTVKKDLGQTVTVKGDGKNIETKVNGGALEVSLKKDVDLGQDGSIKAGNTTINSDGVETNKVKVGDITITDQGINGGAKQITNIASGIDSKQYADAKDNNAASIGDVKKIAGDEAGKAAEAVKSKSGKNITVKDDHTVNLNDNITLGDETDVSKQVSIDGNGAKVTAGDGANQVTVDGSKGQVTIGSGDSAMTLGKQSNTAGDSNPAEGNYLNGLDNRKWDGEHIQNGRAATEDQLKTVSDKVNSGRKFQGDDGKDVTVDLGKTLNIKGGATDVSDAKNIGIVRGDDNTLNVRLAKDLTGLNSVTTGNTTINNSGLTVKTGDANRTITVQDGNVNMGGNQIHNVAPGTAPTDAVNVSQLQQTGRAINQLGSSLDKLGTRVDRVGANSAALAALHPLDFDPDDKLDFAVGAGNYSGANAVALGAFYRPNEDVMFSLGGSTGGGENMVNIGATFKLGQHNHVSNSRVAMAKEIRDLKQLVAKQEGEMQQLKTLMNQMAGRTVMKVDKDALFPDIPENHWAYDYVTKLAKAGIVEGYEDGEFKGNRMMTRYEFAAVIYRAIMAGAGSNPALDQDGTLGKLVKEFDGELKYIRIDVIEKDKHGNPTIERVRTVEDSEKHHGK